MKYLIYWIAFFLLAFPKIVAADDITFVWNANTEPDLAGYKIYYGLTSRFDDTIQNNGMLEPFEYDNVVDVGDVTEYTVKNILDGVFYFTATAYDLDGNESKFCNEIKVDLLRPDSPVGFRKKEPG